MPLYKYLCPDNGAQVEVSHPSDVNLVNWGQLCFVGKVEIGETPFEAPNLSKSLPRPISAPIKTKSTPSKSIIDIASIKSVIPLFVANLPAKRTNFSDT